MDDLISRQAVMDATKTVMKDILDSLPTTLVDGEEIYDVRTSELDFILNINKALKNAIKALPSETHEIRTETHGVCSDELISRAAVIDALHARFSDGFDGDKWWNSTHVLAAVEGLPPVKAVSVVRCKECQFGEFYAVDTGEDYMTGLWCGLNQKDCMIDDFCSRGERRK